MGYDANRSVHPAETAPRLIEVPMGLSSRALLLSVLAVALCACGDERSLAGKYRQQAKDNPTIILSADGTYEFCLDGRPCEIGRYFISQTSDSWDFIGFSGPMIRKFEGTPGNVFYDGFLGPSISFDDPDAPRFEKVLF